MKKATKRGPKPQNYKVVVSVSKKELSDIEIRQIEKILSSILVNAQEEDANDSNSESCRLLSRLVG